MMKIRSNHRAEVGPLGLVTIGRNHLRNRGDCSLQFFVIVMTIAVLFLLTDSMALARKDRAWKHGFPLNIPVTVQAGDTLWKLAHQYGNPHHYILERVDELAHENNLSAESVLQPGQRILIPIHNESEYAQITAKIHQS